MREAAEDLLRLQPDGAQRLADQLPRLRARAGQSEAAQRRRKDVIDPIERVVYAIGVLKHGLNIVAECAPTVPVEPAQIGAPVADLAAAGLGEAEQQAG